MLQNLSVEELVVDDSFINYCHCINDTDILYWQLYEETHPHQKEKIEEARQIVLALHQMFAGEKASGNSVVENVSEFDTGKISFLRKFIVAASSIAAVILLTLVIGHYRNGQGAEDLYLKTAINDTLPAKELVFTTAMGEKKHFVLPDSSRVYLNAGSSLSLEDGFANGHRTVCLTGEALFDIRYDEKHPFVVHVAEYDIKVLGTVFNVKAYPNESISETALLKGKVQILKNDGGDLTLVPNQKVIFRNRMEVSQKMESESTGGLSGGQEIVSLKYNGIDSTIAETAWVQNRLEIVNENFSDIKGKLERWYNVSIVFEDEEVEKYRFTATFRNENIEQVFQALQYAYPFNYRITNNEITVSK